MSQDAVPPKEAAARLHVCLQTVYAWLLSGTLRGERKGARGAWTVYLGVGPPSVSGQPKVVAH